MALLSDFTSQVSKADYWEADQPVIVGVSGGLDSSVLLDMLVHLPKEFKPAVHVAHINHQLRKESDEEEAFVKQLCAAYDVPCSIHKWDRTLHPKAGIEKAAREVRYTFFEKVAKKHKSSIVLTAHHRDDQVETVLMRFVRGNSLDELTGMDRKRQDNKLTIIRPLLSFSKDALHDYALDRQLTWHEDQTNQSDDYTRNRFRHKVLPMLRQENDQVDEHIFTFAEEISGLLSLVEPLVNEKLSQTMVLSEKEIQIDRKAFLELDVQLQKRVLEQAVKNWSEQDPYLMKRNHSALLMDWLNSSPPHSSLNLPNGLFAVREYEAVRLTYEMASHLSKRDWLSTREQYELSPGHRVQLSNEEAISLVSLDTFNALSNGKATRVMYLNLKDEQLPLTIRHRMNGDRMTVKGMKGTKKVKDIFIDQKVPLKMRDEVWVVTDQTDDILWLIGHKESALSLDPITDTISYVLVYEYKK